MAHWCSLVWIFSTRSLASAGVGHGASVFTADLLAFHSQHCELAAPLRHVAGFPVLGLLRGLRPILVSTADSGPARLRPGWAERRARSGWFPRSLLTVRRARHPAFPRQHRHEYAAVLPHGLLAPSHVGGSESPGHCQACAAYRPMSSRFEPVLALRGFHHWFLHSCTVPSCLPGPSRLEMPTRPVVVGAACRPRLRFQVQAAPSFSRLLRQSRRGGPFILPRSSSASWRTTGRQ